MSDMSMKKEDFCNHFEPKVYIKLEKTLTCLWYGDWCTLCNGALLNVLVTLIIASEQCLYVKT